MKRTARLMFVLFACTIGSANAALVTANAAKDFATTQGSNGWNYGYANLGNSAYRTSDFQLFSYANNIQGYSDLNGWTTNPSSSAMITPMAGKQFLHVHPSEQAWSILRYNITTTGRLNTNFSFGRLNPDPQGSVNAHVFLNGQQIWGVDGIRPNQHFGRSWGSMVKAGDKLDYVIDANGSEYYDGSSLQANVTIAPVPEPETYALMGMGLLGLMTARRRKMK